MPIQIAVFTASHKFYPKKQKYFWRSQKWMSIFTTTGKNKVLMCDFDVTISSTPATKRDWPV